VGARLVLVEAIYINSVIGRGKKVICVSRLIFEGLDWRSNVEEHHWVCIKVIEVEGGKI